MRRHGIVFAVTLLLAAALLAACPFAHPLENPKVEVQSVALADASLSGVSIDLGLMITNPNSIGLPLHRIDWDLSLAGAHAASGAIDLTLDIPAKGSTPAKTSLRLGAADAARVAPRLLKGARDYALRADLRFDTSLGPISVTVESRGTL
jgi:LEA14-like dessication related protein